MGTLSFQDTMSLYLVRQGYYQKDLSRVLSAPASHVIKVFQFDQVSKRFEQAMLDLNMT